MNDKQVSTSDKDLRDMIKTSPEEENRPYGGWEGCWPGDGSGMDDFQDFNQNEGWGDW